MAAAMLASLIAGGQGLMGSLGRMRCKTMQDLRVCIWGKVSPPKKETHFWMHSRKCLCSIEKLDIFRLPLTFATFPVKIILQRIISVVWWTNFLSEIWGLPIHDDDCQSLSLSMKRGELDSEISAQPLMIAYSSWTEGRWEWLTLSGVLSIFFCGQFD